MLSIGGNLSPQLSMLNMLIGGDGLYMYFLHFPSPDYVNMIKRLCRKLLYM